MKRRPDLELARRGVVANELSAKRYKRDAYPTPEIFIGASTTRGPYSWQTIAGFQLPLPFFDRNQGLIGRAISDAKGQKQLEQALETRVRFEVTGAWRARQNARQALTRFKEESLVAAEDLLKRAEITYQAGKFSIAELFDAYQTIWEIRSQELEIKRQVASAEAELERAAVLIGPYD